MPEKNVPPDWFLYISSMLITALSGAAGAFVRQIGNPPKKLSERIAGLLGGAFSAVYFTPVLTPITLHNLARFDLISPTSGLTPDSVSGLIGFLSGTVGLTVIEFCIKWLKRRLN